MNHWIKKCPSCGNSPGVKPVVRATILGRSFQCSHCQSNLQLEAKKLIQVMLFVSVASSVYFLESMPVLISLIVTNLILMYLYYATSLLKTVSA